MKDFRILTLGLLCIAQQAMAQQSNANIFPDGSEIPPWFAENTKAELTDLGKQYNITDYGAVEDSNVVQTRAIQSAIDLANQQGGGVVVIPRGVFLSGALFFKPQTRLYLAEGAVLKGSDKIEDYPKIPSRIEGQNQDYFAALVNADKLDSFVICGKGTIDGNGLKFWEAFWARRKENKNCTNLEVSRPRLVYISNSNNVQIHDIRLVNSGFWTSHYYKCKRLKLRNLYIYSPSRPVKAPSTDAIDLDACTEVLIQTCYLSVNDDAIAIKGGKGPWADADTCNGPNANILIDSCIFGFCHAALTCGSESVHTKNVLMRNCNMRGVMRVLWLKMRPDTPQKYEYITIENIQGTAHSFLYVKPWLQFFDLKGRQDTPLSYCENIRMKNIKLKCDIFFDVAISQYDRLSGFSFENFNIDTRDAKFDRSMINGVTLQNVLINNRLIH